MEETMPPLAALRSRPFGCVPLLTLAGMFAASPPAPVVDLEVQWSGPRELREAVVSGSIRPLSLAAGDFDEDGFEDLVAGYSAGRSGLVALFIGDGAARVIRPAGAPAHVNRAPFAPEARLFQAAEIPDILRAGDFDADGHADLVLGAAGGRRLALLRGDGRGGFEPAVSRPLPGTLMRLTSGDMNRRDGLPEIVALLRARGEARLVVFESPAGAFGSEPESLRLESTSPDPVASDIVIADLDGDPWIDVAAAVGNTLAVVHGRDRRLSDTPDARMRVEPAALERLPLEASESLPLNDRDRGRLSRLRTGAGAYDPPAAEPDALLRAAAVLPLRLNADGLDDLVILHEDRPAPAVMLSAFASTFTVTQLAPGDGLCDATCTLGEALAAANASPGADLIQFDIPPAGCRTILWAGGTISDTVTIDGTTQPGFSGGPCITLDGGSVDVPGVSGPSVNASDTVLRGLGFTRFGPVALTLRGSGVIVDNIRLVTNRFLGVDMGTTDGMFRNSSISNMFDSFGRAMLISGSGNQVLGNAFNGGANDGISVGGTAQTVGLPGQGNSVSGYGGHVGLNISAGGSLVQGNRVFSTFGGLVVSGAGSTLGGTVPGAGNSVWSNASTPNAALLGSDQLVQGNNFGADGAGSCLNNGGGATAVSVGGSNTTLGGLVPGAGNLICKGGTGVAISGTGSRVLGNRIGGNNTGILVGGTGITIQGNVFQGDFFGAIDLAPAGPTPNDAGDTDTGANDLQNYPVLKAATCSGGVSGLLDSTPESSFSLELYRSASCHASGFGEGETSLGLLNVTTDASGQVVFGTIPAGQLVPGQVVTATATNGAGSTSEFSGCVPVQGAAPAPMADSVQMNHDAGTGLSTLTWTTGPDAVGADSYRGTIPAGNMGSRAQAYDHTCYERADAAGDGAAVSIDASSPPVREAFYYLVAARNACGVSSLGADSGGATRPNPSPCP
jgi:hypothetical protein